jgi:hypothetical protein
MANIEGMNEATMSELVKLLQDKQKENPELSAFFYNETEATKLAADKFRAEVERLNAEILSKK